MRGKCCTLAFNVDRARNAIGCRVERRRVGESAIAPDAIIDRERALPHIAFMARLDNVWQRVARFHPSVVRVYAGNAGYNDRRGYPRARELQRDRRCDGAKRRGCADE